VTNWVERGVRERKPPYWVQGEKSIDEFRKKKVNSSADRRVEEWEKKKKQRREKEIYFTYIP